MTPSSRSKRPANDKDSRPVKKLTPTFLLVLIVALPGCASFERTRGVDNTWRDADVPTPVVGRTTQSEILKALGPPSQVIGLRDQTVFYYLEEHDKGQGGIFIVYNWLKEDVTYDRAIFFFDTHGVLQDYGLSNTPAAESR
jgi:outer membrane protein assembly factor BamE (lipoprotein component of BamABCDE complex)